jgi:hypothetical protein
LCRFQLHLHLRVGSLTAMVVLAVALLVGWRRRAKHRSDLLAAHGNTADERSRLVDSRQDTLPPYQSV